MVLFLDLDIVPAVLRKGQIDSGAILITSRDQRIAGAFRELNPDPFRGLPVHMADVGLAAQPVALARDGPSGLEHRFPRVKAVVGRGPLSGLKDQAGEETDVQSS